MKTTAFFILAMVMFHFGQSQDVYWVTESNANVAGRTTVKVYDLNNTHLGQYELNRDIRFYSKKDKRLLERLAEKTRKEKYGVSASRNRKGRSSGRSAKV